MAFDFVEETGTWRDDVFAKHITSLGMIEWIASAEKNPNMTWRAYGEDEPARESDLEIAVRDALNFCGRTYDELEKMAIINDFDDLRCRMAWIGIRGLRKYAGETT